MISSDMGKQTQEAVRLADRPGHGGRRGRFVPVFRAGAERPPDAPLPLDELRQLADVYGLIKSDYVEPVEDKKLLSEAIAGMVASLDPHSVYLDEKDFEEMRETVQGKLRRPRHRGGDGRRLRQDRLADRGLARLPRRHQAPAT